MNLICCGLVKQLVQRNPKCHEVGLVLSAQSLWIHLAELIWTFLKRKPI